MTALAFENSGPSLVPAQVAFREKDALWARSEEGPLFSQAMTTPANSFQKFYIQG